MQPGYPPPPDPSGQPPYGQPQHGQPQHGQPQYGQPQYGQPQYGQPQYGQPQYGQPQYGQMPGYPDPFAAPQSSPPSDPFAPPASPAPGYDPYAPQPTSGQPYGYPPAPGVAGYGGPPVAKNNTLGLLALIFGVLSLPLAFCCGFLGLGLGVAAAVLGFLGLKKVNEGAADNRGMALAGLICGGIGVLLTILAFAANFALQFTDLAN